MGSLFQLTFYHAPNGDYRERFDIGMFRARREAETVEARYRREVPGFCDCESVIAEVPTERDFGEVYRYMGWNWSEDGDEVDILTGGCFSERVHAERAMERASCETEREEWCVQRWIVGECKWEEGFVCEAASDEAFE